MKILTLYTQFTPSILRRVKAPLQVLAERGHSCSFMQVENLTAGLAHNADCTILPNWILSDKEFEEYQEMARTRTFVYDLSSPLLLLHGRVQETLQLAHLVTVPTEWLKKEVGTLHRNVQVLPSTIDLPFFLEENRVPRNGTHTLGCFGPFDWDQLVKPLTWLAQRIPRLFVLAGPEAASSFRDAPFRYQEVQTSDCYQYRSAIRQCNLGLQPKDGRTQYDPIWKHEYGVYSIPTLTCFMHDPEHWAELISNWLGDREKQAEWGHVAFLEANGVRATQMAGEYLRVYRKKLPHSFYV